MLTDKETEKFIKEIKSKKIKLIEAPTEIRKNKELIEELLNKDVGFYEGAHETLKADKYFNLKLLSEFHQKKKWSFAIQFFIKRIKSR